MWKKVLVSAIIIGAVLIGMAWFLNHQFPKQHPQKSSTHPTIGNIEPVGEARIWGAGWLFNVSEPSGNSLYFVVDYDLTTGYEEHGGYAVHTEREVKAKINLTNIYPVIKPKSTEKEVKKAAIRANAKYFANESLKVGTPIIKYRNIKQDVRPWIWDTPVYNDSGKGYALCHMLDGDEKVAGCELYSTHEYLNWRVEKMKSDKEARQFLLAWLEEHNIEAKIIESFLVFFVIGQKIGL